VDVQHQRVVKVQEQVLPVGVGGNKDVPVQERRAAGEPALGAGNCQPLAAEDVAELPRQAPECMSFRHYSMTSPVVS
jgi:hypothetical protein